MKIGILAPYSRPWDTDDVEGSGMNLVIRESCDALVKQGHNLKVFIRKSRNTDKRSYNIKNNIEVIPVDTGESKRLNREEAYYSCLNNSFPIESILDCDFIIAHYWIAEAWISKISPNYYSKILYFSHSYFLNPERLRDSVSLLQQKAEISLLSKVVWCASTRKEFTTIKLISEGSDRVAYIPLAIDYKSFSKKEITKTDDIIFVGRKTSAKGYDWFWQLAKDFPQFKFKAIGRDDLLLDKLDNFSDISFLDLKQTRKEISKARLVICPSRYEHFGLVSLECLASKTFMLASKTGGFVDVIANNKTGFLFDGGYDNLKKTFKKFIKSKINFDDKTAEKIKVKFSYENFVKNVEKIVLQKDFLYTGKFINVYKTPITFKGRLIPFEKVDLSGSVHVIPITKDERIIFINELRFNEKKVRLKTVSGIIDQNEKPIEAAKRELEEEAGIKADTLTKLMTISDTGTINDIRHYFLAKDLTFGVAKKEITEDIRGVVFLTKNELLEYLIKGKFGNTRSVVALLKLYDTLTKG